MCTNLLTRIRSDAHALQIFYGEEKAERAQQRRGQRETPQGRRDHEDGDDTPAAREAHFPSDSYSLKQEMDNHKAQKR